MAKVVVSHLEASQQVCLGQNFVDTISFDSNHVSMTNIGSQRVLRGQVGVEGHWHVLVQLEQVLLLHQRDVQDAAEGLVVWVVQE